MTYKTTAELMAEENAELERRKAITSECHLRFCERYGYSVLDDLARIEKDAARRDAPSEDLIVRLVQVMRDALKKSAHEPQ